MIEIFAYIALFLIVYTYLLYPIVLFGIVKAIGSRKTQNCQHQSYAPRVAILCAMYNEEKVVRDKLENFFQIKYPDIKIYIGSDGSTDTTNQLLEEYSSHPNIVIHKFPRRGKVHVLNDLIMYADADADVFIFTDANTMFDSWAVERLLSHFNDSQVGCVCGRLILLNNGTQSGEGVYWRYETLLKKLESHMNCVIGANGAIFAVRKELVKPLPMTTINDDFTISMRVAEQGYGIKYALDAIAFEEHSSNDYNEFKRHVRDGAGHYRAMVHLFRLFNPINFKVFFFYISHRVIRWFVPFLLIFLLTLPLLTTMSQPLFFLYMVQVLFYGLVLIGRLTQTKIKIFYIPYYFIYINIALLIGFMRTIIGVQKVTWDSTQR